MGCTRLVLRAVSLLTTGIASVFPWSSLPKKVKNKRRTIKKLLFLKSLLDMPAIPDSCFIGLNLTDFIGLFINEIRKDHKQSSLVRLWWTLDTQSLLILDITEMSSTHEYAFPGSAIHGWTEYVVTFSVLDKHNMAVLWNFRYRPHFLLPLGQ